MVKFVYRTVLLLLIVGMVWYGIHYVMKEQKKEHVGHGVELVKADHGITEENWNNG